MALGNNTVWEVRTTGSDANGGGFDTAGTGTDYSQQDAAQFAYTDLVIGSTTTQLSSVARPFVAADVGNMLNIASGTGFTAGVYEVNSVSGGVATMDRAVGTAASTGGTGNLGGAFATPGRAGQFHTQFHTVWVKAGTYSITTVTQNVANGAIQPTTETSWRGYNTTRGDRPTGSNRPTLQASGITNTYLMGQGANGQNVIAIENFILDGASLTGISGINFWNGARGSVYNCRAYRCVNGFNLQASHVAVNCEADTCSGTGFGGGAGLARVIGCWAHGCGTGFASGTHIDCLATACTTGFSTGAATLTVFVNCTAYGSGTGGGSGYFITDGSAGAGNSEFINCIAYNYGTGFNLAANQGSNINSPFLMVNCAAGGCATNINYGSSSQDRNIGFVTLTANPFTNAAGGDWSLNNTAGGGGSLRAAGLPQTFPGLATTASKLDIGAVQHQDSGGGYPLSFQLAGAVGRSSVI